MCNFANYRRALTKLCTARGWALESGAKHFRLTRPGVLGHITASVTPRSERRALWNTESLMKRAEKSGTCCGLTGGRTV